MKRILTSVVMLGLACAGMVRAADAPVSNDNDLVWCGLDYSLVKMIGTTDFLQPERIFPEAFDQWNILFMTEMLPQLEKMAPSVKSDLKPVTARNAKASAKQIQREDGTRDEMVTPTHITDADIAKAVKSYSLKYDKGTGLVFIIDRMVKAQETECLYIVFFDISSRKVLHSERLVTPAGGMGFRNFWFKPIKTAVKGLPKTYKTLGK